MDAENKAFHWHVIFLAFLIGLATASFSYHQREIPLITYVFANGDTVKLPAGATPDDIAAIVKTNEGKPAPRALELGNYSLR